MPIDEMPSTVTDPKRLALLSLLALIDSREQAAFNRLTRLAVRLLDVSAALVSLIDEGQQVVISGAGPAAPSWFPLSLPDFFWRNDSEPGQPLTIDDTQQNTRDTPAINDVGIRAYASMLLLTSAGDVVGAFCAVSTAPRAWTVEDIAAVKDLAALVTTEIERCLILQVNHNLEASLDQQSQQHSVELAQREETLQAEITEHQNAQLRLRRQNRYMVAINEIAVAAIHRLDLTDLLTVIAHRARILVEAADSAIWLVDPDEAGLTVRTATGSLQRCIGFKARAGEGMAGKVWQTGQPMIVEDYATWDDPFTRSGYVKVHAVVQMPLRSEGRVLGVLLVAHSQAQKTFASQDIALLERFAEIAAITIVNAQTITALHTELAERQRTEALLEQERNLLRIVIDNLPDHIFVKDTQGRYTVSNLAHTDTIRLISDIDIIGKLPADMFPREVAEQLHSEDMAILNSGVPVIDNERIVPDLTGTLHWLLSSKIPFNDAQGKLLGLIGITHDITERKRAELLEEQERNLLRTLIDNIPDYVFVKDRQGRFIISNAALTRATDVISDTGIAGKVISDVYSSALSQTLDAEDEVILSTGQALLNVERLLVDWAGNPHWLLSTKVPLKDTQGQIVGLIGITRDVTERKQAELQLEQERNLLRTLVDNIPDYIFVKDTEGRFLISNEAHTLAAHADSSSDIVGKLPFDLFPPKLAEQFHADDMAILNSGQPLLNLERLTVDAAGAPRWVLTTKVPLRDKQGQLIGLVGISRDITARKVAEDEIHAAAVENAQLYDRLRHHADELEQRVAERTKELQAAKEQAEAILDTSSDAILVIGLEGGIEQVNPAFNHLFGYPVAEVLNQPLPTLADSGSIEKLHETLQYVMQTGQSQRLEIVGRRRDGRVFDADLALAPILRPVSVIVVGVVCNIRDITQRKLIEQELRHTLEKERELNELKTRFVSLVSHEFRTPLAIILAASNILKSYGDRLSSPEKQDRFLKIETGVAQMTNLLEDVLTVSKGDAGQLRFEPVPLDLEMFCREIMGEAQMVWGQRHLFEFTRQGTTTQVTMDPQLLQHILLNLLSNAVKHSPVGSTVHFDLSCEPLAATFRIRDEGLGIPASDQLKLFDAFHRGENVTGIAGTGLGLTIVKQAVLRHGGSIHFESTVNVGTVFVVTIPNTTTEHPQP